MAKTEHNSFVLYLDSAPFFEALSDSDAGKLIKAVFDYKQHGLIPDFDDGSVTKLAFGFIKSYLDRDEQKYLDRIESNRRNGYRKIWNESYADAYKNKIEADEAFAIWYQERLLAIASDGMQSVANASDDLQNQRTLAKSADTEKETDRDTEKETDRDNDRGTDEENSADPEAKREFLLNQWQQIKDGVL